MNLKINRTTFAECVCFALLSCSTITLAGQANTSSEPDTWQEGWQIFDDANESFVIANQNIAKGRKMIREGEDEIVSAGESLKLSRNSYVALVEAADPSPENIESLANLQADIDQNIAAIIAGNNLVSEGHVLVAKAQEQIKQSRLSMQKGYGKANKSSNVVQFKLMLPESKGDLN